MVLRRRSRNAASAASQAIFLVLASSSASLTAWRASASWVTRLSARAAVTMTVGVLTSIAGFAVKKSLSEPHNEKRSSCVLGMAVD